MNYVFSTEKPQRYRFPTHINDLVMDRSQAVASEVFIVVIEPGGAPPLHQHDDTEQVFYVLEGAGDWKSARKRTPSPSNRATLCAFRRHTAQDPRTSSDALRYLAIDCFPAARPAAEPTWDDHVRVVCAEKAGL